MRGKIKSPTTDENTRRFIGTIRVHGSLTPDAMRKEVRALQRKSKHRYPHTTYGFVNTSHSSRYSFILDQ